MPSKVKDMVLVRTSGTLVGTDKFYVAANAGNADAQCDLSELSAYIAGQVIGGGANAELIRDTIGAALVQAAGITITVNDPGDTITIAADPEVIRDTIGASLVAGTGITITVNDPGDTITIAATGTPGNAWNLQWGPLVNEAPSANFATVDSRNGHPTLDFDTTTQETAIFSGVLPADYSGAGVTIHLYCSLTTAITGTVGWDVAFERMDASSLDIDADSFGAATTVTAVTVPGTSGQLLKMSVNVSNGANMDSLAAGEMFRLRIRRDVANDTAAGDAELLRVMMVSQ